ncbi:MAG: FAD-dependent oxidoreductase, partial [Rikenellaceae bacterium]|nr:FAD-dependent oxidoreductase [Rikenellaceae bacterium]
GKISELRTGGYRFDTGPSLFTLPELVEELFSLCGEKMADHLPYRRLEVNCHYFFERTGRLVFYHDPEKLQKAMEETGIADPDSVFRRLGRAREVYELSAPVFLFTDFHTWSNFRMPPYRKIARKLYKLDFLRSMHRANRKDFRDGRLVKIFDRYATYNGSNPYRAPATLNMIAHLENNIGAFFPEKGIYSIVEELYALALRQGVRFRFDTPVTGIVTENGQAVAVETAADSQCYERIVSDVDVKYLARRLMKDHPLHRRLERSRPSSSALIFYWRIDRIFPRLDLYNILFAEDYKSEFEAIFRYGRIADDPTVYLFISSKVVPDDAPAGCENWFVMINVPSDSGQPWPEMIARARKNVIRKIDRILGTSIQDHIVGEQVAFPPTLEKKYLQLRRRAVRGGFQFGLVGLSPASEPPEIHRQPALRRRKRSPERGHPLVSGQRLYRL